MNRNREYYRRERQKHINRKKKILHEYLHDYSWYENEGELAKGKIHCSCGLCRAKTNNKSFKKRTIHRNYSPNHNWKASDIRKIESMNYREKEGN